MIEMTRRQIVPAVVKYIDFLSLAVCRAKDTGLAVDVSLQANLLKDISAAAAQMRSMLQKLERTLEKASVLPDGEARALAYQDKVLPAMEELRRFSDQLETLIGKEYWPIPSYSDLLFGIM